ncbi:Clp protease ClpP [Erythrobacteraceae bacterium CFH 75059]|uniref:head maturation protease, ClpP-related n=1 Tax=Qipengyuania thermophila TaxID=2509361 RepID=UPI00101F8BDA|nr:head maturation protease, ClpP-related [Qipengyuania thermophila]TCD04269.1 Clp protease ClpP [Erythrobacteraceae bacterium CFH 75059]
MSKRQLPELTRPDAPDGLDFSVHPQARAAFDPSVTAASRDDATISILSEIGENWDGTGVTPNRIRAALRSIGDRPVTVQINSPGGNFFDGLAIYNMLRAHPETVTVHVIGIAASAASIIAMSADDLRIAKAGLMMIHNTQWIAMGDRHTMAETFETMKVFDDLLAQLYADRTGISASEIGAMMDAETFMSGEDSVKNGFADQLLPGDNVTAARNMQDRPVAYRLEAALAKAGMPRAERRSLLKEITEVMPSAASDPAMPSAGELDEGLARLRAASMRLRLCK